MYKVFINEKPVTLTDQVPETKLPVGTQHLIVSGTPDFGRIIHEFESNDEARELIIINTKNFDLLRKDFESFFTSIVTGGGIVYHPDKGMLWILRHKRWDLPKGKPNGNESMEEAAIREVSEETGLKNLYITRALGITRHAYREKNKFILKTSHWYKMGVESPDCPLTPQLEEGITEVEWATDTSIKEKINNTYASLQQLAKEFVTTHTPWEL
ncbi:MAG: NUDIX domain-containing protein [Bacteroidales bacterium]|nr:NUDIX domain-containing protein [Bacteroidales bacterium]